MVDYDYPGSIFTREGQIKFLIIFGIGLVIILAVFLSMGSPTSSTTDADLSVSAHVNSVGDHLIVTTRAINNGNTSVSKAIAVYVVDGTGIKHFVDIVQADLGPGETGTARSSIKKDEAGPPPHSVITD